LKTQISSVNQLEWNKPSFAMPSMYPEWFSPNKVELKDSKNNHFTKYLPLVESGEIEMVHTSGHTVGHCSVLIKTSEIHYLLAGDATYDQHQLEQGINVGGHQSFKLGQTTYKEIKSYASKNKLVYLPSHDNQVFDRIQNDH